MEYAAIKNGIKTEAGGADTAPDTADARAAQRTTLLIRAAKLVAANGEFVCVIRDVSETGVSVRLFHALPADETFELHMPGGEVYSIRRVWERDSQAGFEFVSSVDVVKLINEAGEYPKRGLRLGLCFPVRISTLTTCCSGFVENLSQQGARIECEELFAMDQNLRIAGDEGAEVFAELRAKIRWRRDRKFGVVFDDTFTLGNFARLAAQLQMPGLLHHQDSPDVA